RVVELPDALEAGGERDSRERQLGRLDQHARGLRPLGAGNRKRTGAELTEQQPVEMALTDGEPARQSGDAVAIDGPIRNQPHRAADEVAAHVPFRGTRRSVRAAALAGTIAGELRRSRRGVERHVLALGPHRRRAARPAVDAGRPDGGDEPAVEARVAAFDGSVATLEVQW